MKSVVALLGLAALGVLAQPLHAGEHAAVGADKCGKMCHRVQYESWAKSKHATATPKVECETCHGNGADYMKLSVMKDLAKAQEAGLIAKPEMAACTAKCHKPAEIKPEMLPKVHEHKVKK